MRKGEDYKEKIYDQARGGKGVWMWSFEGP